MTDQIKRLPDELKNDLSRNREGRLSSRQWIQLITEPLSTLLLLSVPLILIVGRYGPAGRLFVLLIVLGFGLTIAFRAVRFSRVKLHYRVLYVEQLRPRWMFWRKINLVTKTGDTLQFDHHIISKLKLQPDQAMMTYYIDIGDRRVLVSLVPQKHPEAKLAQPTSQFKSRNGVLYEH